MTTIICSGTLFSDWRSTLKKLEPFNSDRLPLHTDISALSKEIYKQQFPEINEFDWKPFNPEERFKVKATQLIASAERQELLIWEDRNAILCLNFWKSISEDTGFVLFYSSPEYELSKFFDSNPVDLSLVESIIDAWLIRTTAMLVFFMNNRDRCLFINSQFAISAQSEFIKTLNKKFELDLDSGTSESETANSNSPLLEYLSTTLLLNNRKVADVYDEVRSMATLLANQNNSILGIEERNKSLINSFLTETKAYEQLGGAYKKLGDEFSSNRLQMGQIQKELEFISKKSTEQENTVAEMVDYLSDDPLLKITRQARQMQ